MTGNGGIRDAWPWDWEYLRLWLFLPPIIAMGLALGYYPKLGFESLWFLFISFAGIPFIIIYWFVGNKVRSLRTSLNSQEGEMSESIMAIGIIESPGIAILNSNELLLVPIVGKRLSISFSEIETVRESTWLPGKKLLWKKVFLLTTPTKKELPLVSLFLLVKNGRTD